MAISSVTPAPRARVKTASNFPALGKRFQMRVRIN